MVKPWSLETTVSPRGQPNLPDIDLYALGFFPPAESSTWLKNLSPDGPDGTGLAWAWWDGGPLVQRPDNRPGRARWGFGGRAICCFASSPGSPRDERSSRVLFPQDFFK